MVDAPNFMREKKNMAVIGEACFGTNPWNLQLVQ